jgi:ATP-dependent DNA helicase RecQ
MRRSSAADLVIADGMVEAAGSRVRKAERVEGRKRRGQPAANDGELTKEGAALAAKLKTWRAGEAKRLGLPAYMVLHDRTLEALARTRPRNPREMLEVDGMGPGKMERFGAAILELCGRE